MLTCQTGTHHSSPFHFPCLVCVEQRAHGAPLQPVVLVEVLLVFLSGERRLRSGER